MLASEWRREGLRTNLWFVPALEVASAIALFAATHAVDQAAYRGELPLPAWVVSGTADAARQILTALAAAVITVVGVVFSIMIVTLTLASTQFGPRMLRNFIRDRGTQLTLGTFVATFVYAILALVSIGPGPHGDFVPHVSITVTLALVVDLGVLIYFINHIATTIQLPHVIAAIARDLARAIANETAEDEREDDRVQKGPSVSELERRMAEAGVVSAASSDYLQYVHHATLVRLGAQAGAVIRLQHRPGHCEDRLSSGWLGESLCHVPAHWRPVRVHRDTHGYIRVVTLRIGYNELVQRAFDKIRQAGRGMPAIMIRQLDALAKLTQAAASDHQRHALLEQAAMIGQSRARAVLNQPMSPPRPSPISTPGRGVLARCRRGVVGRR